MFIPALAVVPYFGLLECFVLPCLALAFLCAFDANQDAIRAWLSSHRPLILCGPPGSGKTMTLMSTLRSSPDFELAALNFSSATTPELLLSTFDQSCEYRRTPTGTVRGQSIVTGRADR